MECLYPKEWAENENFKKSVKVKAKKTVEKKEPTRKQKQKKTNKKNKYKVMLIVYTIRSTSREKP